MVRDVPALLALISPALPVLSNLSEKSADGMIHKMGADTWDRAKKILTKLKPNLINNSDAQEAVQIFIDDPNNLASKFLLRNQFKKILEDNKQLAREIAPLIKIDSDTIKTNTIETSASYNTIQKFEIFTIECGLDVILRLKTFSSVIIIFLSSDREKT